MRRPLISLMLTTSLLVFAGAAVADTVRVDDPAGDGRKGRALDITTVKVANRDHAIVTDLRLVRAAYGDLGIYYSARGDRRRDVAGVFSEHRARGDQNGFRTIDGVQPCKGLSVTWDHELDTVRVRLPSRCFRDGDYGAIRVRVITEIGSDADIAPNGPEGRWTWTPWIGRG